MSLPTPSQSVSHKRFHQCVNHKKKLSLRHPLPTFGSFSFFQASLWLGVDKVLQKLTKSYKSELRHLFQCCILIPRKCPRKTPFQHTVGGGKGLKMCLRNIWMVPIGIEIAERFWFMDDSRTSLCSMACSFRRVTPSRPPYFKMAFSISLINSAS